MDDEKTNLDKLKARVEEAASNAADGGLTEEAIDQAAKDILPTLDEAATELAAQLGERYEKRLEIRKRLLQGLAPSGKLRRNAKCPCGSGKKFKHCHMAGYKKMVNDRINPKPEEAQADDAHSDQS